MERVADYIIRKVNEAGAKHIFLITGRGILYLSDAVAKNKNVTPVSMYHEQGISYAAMAYAGVTGGVSACLVSTGCAATNAVTACLCAYQDNLPVVFISGNNQLLMNTRHTGETIRTYGSQEADIIGIVEPITKYAVMLESEKDVVREVEKALFIAMDGRKGPVWIDVPLDVQNMRMEEAEQEHFVQAFENRIVERDKTQYLKDALSHAKRPVILAGGGARDAKAEIKILAEKYNIPVVFSPAACDLYGAENELSIGAVGSIGGSRAGNFAIQNSDFILAVGSKLCAQLTGRKNLFARDAKIAVIDIDEKEHKKDGVKIDTVIQGDAKEVLSALIEENPEVHASEWTEKCKHWKEVFSVQNEPFVGELKDENKIDLYTVADELGKCLPDSATVITDAGFEELVIPSAIPFKDGQRCLFPASQGAMGYAIPAIVGAYEAGREGIYCIVGDGSVMMNLQELQIISDLQIPVKIIVINNNMYAVIRKRQNDLFRNRTIGTDPQNGVPEPDFSKIAQCFGFVYRKIENRDALVEGFSTLAGGKAEIIEIISVPDQKYLHESFAMNENRKLVHRPIEDMAPFLPRDLIRKEMIVDMTEE